MSREHLLTDAPVITDLKTEVPACAMRWKRHRISRVRAAPLAVLVLLVLTTGLQMLRRNSEGRSDDLLREIQPGSELRLASRRLLLYNTTLPDTNCTPPSILEFPNDPFTQNQRQHGAVVLNFLVAFYMFWAVAVVCDGYFVPSLEVICDKLGLQTDVAGATLMALGSSAPELFASIIGVFITKGDIGIGTILGSAVFNVLFVVGVCGVFAGTVMYLAWWPLVRDSLFYFLSMAGVMLVIMDKVVTWPEATALTCFYFVYLLAMYFNSRIEAWLHRITDTKNPEFKSQRHAEANGINGYSPLANKEKGESMEKEEREVSEEEEEAGKEDSEGHLDLEAPDLTLGSPFNPPDNKWALICWILGLPINAAYFFTIPDVRKEGCRRFAALAFVVCIVWIGLTSYVLVWMVTVIGYTFMIPDTIMGLSLVSIGASVPDCLASLFVARKGDGDMAVSQTVGSNVFDILICLGIPWFIKTVMAHNSTVAIDSQGLFTSCLVIMASLVVALTTLYSHDFVLNKRVGCIYLAFYFVFMAASIGVEFYFDRLGVPMCEIDA